MGKEIIILTVSMGNDGAERVLSELSREWIKLGHKVTIIQTNAGSYDISYKIPEESELLNIHVSGKIKPIRYIQEIHQVVKVLRQRPNATVVSFIAASIFICGVSSFFVKNKIVVSERNNPTQCPSGKLQQKLRDWAFCQADVCVFQTEDAMKMFPKKVQNKGVIIQNPINGNLLKPYNGVRRKAIVAACRLHPQKNLPMLINAFSMLHKERPEYVLEIYGQGKEKDNLECLIQELGLQTSVLLKGFSSNIHEAMYDAAMYVSSSDYEGISNSMLEAMGMGLPTVVTDCPVGGARMVIQNEVNGLLVKVGDTDGFYKSMKRIIDDENFAENIGKEACKVCDRFPIDKIVQKWIEIL